MKCPNCERRISPLARLVRDRCVCGASFPVEPVDPDAPPVVLPTQLLITPEMLDTLRSEAFDAARGVVESEVREQLLDELRPKLSAKLYEEARVEVPAVVEFLRSTLSAQITDVVVSKLSAELSRVIVEQVGPVVERNTFTTLRQELSARLFEQLEPALRSEFKSQLVAQLREQIAQEVLPMIHTTLFPDLRTEVLAAQSKVWNSAEFKEALHKAVLARFLDEYSNGLVLEVRTQLKDTVKAMREQASQDLALQVVEVATYLKQAVVDAEYRIRTGLTPQAGGA